MRLLTKIKQFFGIAEKTHAAQIELDSSGVPWFWEVGYINGYNFSSYSMREFILNGYGRNPFVFMCIDKIASVSAQLNWELIDEKTGKQVTDSGLIGLLLRPNNSQTWDDFYYQVCTSLLATGNAFIRKETAVGFRMPTNLQVLKPDLVEIYTVGAYKDDPILFYTYDGIRIEKEEILHIKYSNLLERTHWGLSKLQSGLQVYEASNNIFEAESHLHKNLGITGVLSNKDGNSPMLPKEQQRMQQQWEMSNGGAKNFGRVMVTTASLDYLKLGMSPEDLQTLEGQLAKMRTICSLFGLDSSLFNDPDNKTFANREQAEKSMYESVIKPLCEKINRALSADIVASFGYPNAVIQAKFEGVAVLAEDKSIKHAEILQALNAGVLTAAEARAILFPELPEQLLF